MIPLLLDLSDQRVLIVGGGEVAARKAAYFAPEAEVTVVSRSFHPSMPGGVRRVESDLSELSDPALRLLCEGAFLVIAATSDTALNDRIVRAAAAAGAHSNSASGTPGDVQLPAVSRGDRYVIAVSTGGESPGVARFLREAIEARFPALDRMIELQGRLRSELRARCGDQRERSAVLRRVLEDGEVWDALGRGDGQAWRLVEARYLHA